MKKKFPLSPQEFKYIFKKVPRLCVDLVIKSRSGILFSKREIKPWKGMWHLPGGTVLLGDTLKSAAMRVAQEETGLKIEVVRMMGFIEWHRTDTGKRTHAVSVVFLVRAVDGRLRGSWQARDVDYFNHIPRGTVREQRTFLSQNRLL